MDVIKATLNGVREELLYYKRWSLGRIVDIPLRKLIDGALAKQIYQQSGINIRRRLLTSMIKCGIKYQLLSKFKERGAWRLRFENTRGKWDTVLSRFIACVEADLRARLPTEPVKQAS